MQHVRAQELADWLADDSRKKPVLLDVREPWEVEMCCLPGSQALPMHLVPVRCGELNENDEIVVICHHGARSMQVANFLQAQGFKHVANVYGGIDAWSSEVDPAVPHY